MTKIEKKLVRSAITSVMSILLCLSHRASAQAEDPSRLEQLNQEIAAHTAELQQLMLRRKDREAELKKLDNRLKTLRDKELDLKNKREDRERERKGQEKKIAATELQIITLEHQTNDRVRALYLYQPKRLLPLLLRNDAHKDLAKHSLYLQHIRQADLAHLQELSQLRAEQGSQQADLDTVLAQTQALEREIQTQAALTQKERRTKEELLRLVDQERAQAQETVTQLRAEALRLETVVASLTSGEEPRARIEPLAIEKPIEVSRPAPFEGSGLAGKKGKIPWPVGGRIIADFGKKRDGDFSALVFTRGIELLVVKAAQVGVVADGQVVFAGELPGYGPVVIVDHGARYHTLYARLSQIEVGVGQIVKTGAVLGACGLNAQGQSALYFELRENGVAVNPRKFLSPLSVLPNAAVKR